MIFVDFPCPDPEAMSNFYAELFGWTFNRRPAGEFHEVLPGVKPNLGIHRDDTPMSGPVPRIYVMVDEPPTFLARAVGMGATVLWEERSGRSSVLATPPSATRGVPRSACGATRGRTSRPR